MTAEDDDGESVELTFGSALPAGVSAGSVPTRRPSPSTTTTMPVVEVSFEHSSYSVTTMTTSEKENEVTVKVTLDGRA